MLRRREQAGETQGIEKTGWEKIGEKDREDVGE